MEKLRSPIRWFGGKGRMTGKIVPILEDIPHRFYCEPFGGGASVLLAKRPRRVETYNDIDSNLYNFFCVISDPVLFPKFKERVRWLPYSRQLYNEYRNSWHDESDPVSRAVKWYVVARQSFAGRFNSGWGSVITSSSRNRASTASGWQTALTDLTKIHSRLQRVQIENANWDVILDRYDTPNTLFYCDPPYIHSTRKNKRYVHEMADADHERLVEKLLQIKGSVAVSGYEHPIYNKLAEKNWIRHEYKTSCHAAGRTRMSSLQGSGAASKIVPRIEYLWVKPYG